MLLYHYTTDERCEAIVEARRLDTSIDITDDPTYGAGWYFTDLRPGSCEKAIMMGRWQRITSFEKIKSYVLFNIYNHQVMKIADKENLFFASTTLGGTFRLTGYGDNSECPKKPCSECPQNVLFEK